MDAGPVEDLERHLPQEWWRTLFDRTYLLTDGDVVEDDAVTAREVDMLLAATKLSPADRVLDLCCGQGRHVLDLARRGFQNVCGADASEYLIGVGRKRASDAGHSVQFEVRDARAVTADEFGRFQCVTLMGNSFGYFEAESDDRAVLQAIFDILAPGGIAYLDIADGGWLREHFEKRSWEWVGPDTFVCRERELKGDRLISRELVVETGKGVVSDRYYAERLYTKERLTELLEQAGFFDVTVIGDLEATSQDPGMMAHRFLVVARRAVKVAVLMGDPRLPDKVKVGGVFGEADHETIDKMWTALTALKGVKATLVNNHAEYIAAVQDAEADLALNLCDEGFRNDARAEATVPALLEVLGLPYTGAGPGCLHLCYDKALVRDLATMLDIRVPYEMQVPENIPCPTWEFAFPAIVKPNFGDSSVGITNASVVRSQEALVEAVARLRAVHGTLIVQEFLEGAEYTVGLLGNPGSFDVLPVLEVDYSRLPEGHAPILGYESKWLAGSPWWDQIRYSPAEVADGPRAHIVEMVQASQILFERLGCRDYARFDWRADAEGRPCLLEVNPNPGWCWDGKMAIMLGMRHEPYEALLRAIIAAGIRRYWGQSSARSLRPDSK